MMSKRRKLGSILSAKLPSLFDKTASLNLPKSKYEQFIGMRHFPQNVTLECDTGIPFDSQSGPHPFLAGNLRLP